MLRGKTAGITGPPTAPLRLPGIRYFLLLWPLFFAICFGLGYPILRRYDPRMTEGLSDASKYSAIITDSDRSNFKPIFRGRLLVPYVARPFYWFGRSYLHSWNPAFFGLLMSCALFCATTACLIVSIGNRLLNDLSTALVGTTLYLLSFAIPNLQLAGLIDAGEACFMVAVIWGLLTRRWYLLPLWGLLGALAKETFMPFSCFFAVTWWFVENRQKTRRLSEFKWTEFKWIAVMAVVEFATVTAVDSNIAGQLMWPWKITDRAGEPVNFFVALWNCLIDRNFWYVLGWLLPLGVWRLRSFPKPWLIASIATSIFAVILGAYSNVQGNVGRAIFNIAGPLLSLSVALLLARPPERFVPAKPENPS